MGMINFQYAVYVIISHKVDGVPENFEYFMGNKHNIERIPTLHLLLFQQIAQKRLLISGTMTRQIGCFDSGKRANTSNDTVK